MGPRFQAPAARWLGIAAVGLCLATPASAASIQAERDLGRQFALAARQRLPLISDAEIVGYVDGIGQKIVRALEDSPFAYRFSVVRDARINAFAVPGGYIYVHSGLLTRAANDDELAAVLSHEIAHVHAHHLARQQEATQLMNYATLLGVLLSVVHPAIGAGAAATNAAVQLKYRREFEQEADYLGSQYLRAAGYDPRGMLDFFKKMADEQRITPTFAPPYLLSHPLTDTRLNHLEAVLRIKQWSPGERNPRSFALRRVQVLTRARSEAPADVVAAYRQGVESEPADPVARYLFGVACLETGQLDAAREALAAAQAGGVAAAERELGRLLLRQRQPEKARALLRRAVEAEPADAAAYAELAKAEEVLGETAAAIKAYRRAIELAPELEAAHYGLAILTGRVGDQAEGFYHLAEALRLRGEYEKALSHYARVEPLLPAGDPRAAGVRETIKELSGFLGVKAPRGSGQSD